MTEILELKQRLKVFYSRYDSVLLLLVKFVLAFFSFMTINSQIGFMQRLTNPMVVLLLALFCALLPANMIGVFGALLICGHAFALSIEIFAMVAGVFLIMYVIYFWMAPEYGFVLALVPVAFFFKIPYALPLVFGLVGGPACVVPVSCGTVAHYLIYYMKMNETMLSNSEGEEITSRLSYLAENILNNKEMILTILVFAVTLVAVYVIHRSGIDYAWYLAIGSGAVLNIILFLVGGLVLGAKVSILSVVLGTAAAVAVALAVEFMVLGVDYSRTEYTQFEDDEYYYYVKAVPKMSIAVTNKKVKKISSAGRGNRRRK